MSVCVCKLASLGGALTSSVHIIYIICIFIYACSLPGSTCALILTPLPRAFYVYMYNMYT